MISFLSSVLIAGRENVTDPVVRQKYGMLCGAVGICLNLLLFAGKFFAGTVANSIAITADAVNNLSDAGFLTFLRKRGSWTSWSGVSQKGNRMQNSLLL